MSLYNRYPIRQKALKDHRPLKWTVFMETPQAEENVYGRDNWVSYHNSLDAGVTSSLSMAISTASRYRGKIYADYDNESILVRSYN